MLDVSKQENFETSPVESNVDIKEDALPEATTVVVAAAASEVPVPQIQQPSEIIPTQKIKKVSSFFISYCYKRFNIEYYFFRTLCLNRKKLLLLDEKYVYFVSSFNDL